MQHELKKVPAIVDCRVTNGLVGISGDGCNDHFNPTEMRISVLREIISRKIVHRFGGYGDDIQPSIEVRALGCIDWDMS